MTSSSCSRQTGPSDTLPEIRYNERDPGPIVSVPLVGNHLVADQVASGYRFRVQGGVCVFQCSGILVL